ncbi:MAG: FkbM family methyltransferase [Nitrospirae bacterium]|nr:FkbM family methyltransferase [Nitrospirota bacterium]
MKIIIKAAKFFFYLISLIPLRSVHNKKPSHLFIDFISRFYVQGQTVKIKFGINRGLKWHIPQSSDNELYAMDYERLEKYLIALGLYEYKLQKALKRLIKSGQICYDIGGNIGFFTVLMSRITGSRGKVYVFEPMVSNVEILKIQIKNNNLDNVAIYNKAVTSQNTRLKFIEHNNRSIGQIADNGLIFFEINNALDRFSEELLPENIELWKENKFNLFINGRIDSLINEISMELQQIYGNQSFKSERINLLWEQLRQKRRRFSSFTISEIDGICIDDMVDNTINPPDFIKIDIEGAEALALNGMIKTLTKYHPTIFIELHSSNLAVEVKEILGKVGGYEIFDLNFNYVDYIDKLPGIICIPNIYG